MNSLTLRTISSFFCLLLGSFCLSSQIFAQGNGPTLLMTFTNLTPVPHHTFGISVASAGSGQVLIGAPPDYAGRMDAGAAYLYSDNGTLLTTFTNPVPAELAYFGAPVVMVGSDRAIIGAIGDNAGATNAGAVFLFSISGTLLTVITNPTPAPDDFFGLSAAAVGSNLVLIGAPRDDTVGADAGAAYLFNTNGVLLTTFTSPAPVDADQFGYTVASVGDGCVLIGAPFDDTGEGNAGAAYLFRTNGTLLKSFTNPTPESDDWFGISLAGVGSDRVLIGAQRDNTGATAAGAAYLFRTNGILLTTFTNPTPEVGDYFGSCVAALGGNRVLIGAYGDDSGATDAGAAYLLSTNGTLLNTFTNPFVTDDLYFGASLAAFESDRVLVGAPYDDAGETYGGSLYLFALPYPPLNIARDNTKVTLKWISPETGLALQQASALNSSTLWSSVTDSISIIGLTNLVEQTMETTNRYFRLHRP